MLLDHEDICAMIYTLSTPENFLTKCFLVKVLGYGNE
jgi:hypothetical protein